MGHNDILPRLEEEEKGATKAQDAKPVTDNTQTDQQQEDIWVGARQRGLCFCHKDGTFWEELGSSWEHGVCHSEGAGLHSADTGTANPNGAVVSTLSYRHLRLNRCRKKPS